MSGTTTPGLITDNNANQKSYRLSYLTQNSTGYSSVIQYTVGDLISNLTVKTKTSNSLTIEFTSVPQAFTKYVVVTSLPNKVYKRLKQFLMNKNGELKFILLDN